MSTAEIQDDTHLLEKAVRAILELREENERLKQHIRDLDHDLNAACQSEPDGLSEREALEGK